jgi:hypothetical protein
MALKEMIRKILKLIFFVRSLAQNSLGKQIVEREGITRPLFRLKGQVGASIMADSFLLAQTVSR